MHSSGNPDVPDSRLPLIAAEALRTLLDRNPVEATYLGDHDRDGLLPDPSASAAQERCAQLRTLLAELDALAVTETGNYADVDDVVDAAVLRTALAAELFQVDELREDEWNPMVHNPGPGLHALLSRNFAALPDRLESTTQRLAAIPDYLAAARERLGEMSAVHLETARQQLAGTIALIDTEVTRAAEQVPQLRGRLAPAVEAARAALVAHREWLAQRTDAATRDPRTGKDLFAAKLALTMDTSFDPDSLLAQAESDLERTEHDIAEQAAQFADQQVGTVETVRAVLDRLAADAPTDETILQECVSALAETTSFVRDRDLVTVYDDPVSVVEMPEIDRGVAVAYCRPNGPLERADLPTEMSVSPTPRDWDQQRVASFYREYNRHMVQGLTVHEAMPGHALQLMHANRHRGRTPVRRIWWSGSFVEGWAVYAEELMVDEGYRRDVSASAAAALRMQQLKMRLRTVLNTILDIRFHCGDLDERNAMDLMQRRGFQEDGEAAGKWRRVQLSSTQLCTYYVGYLEVRALADDLRAAHPDWSQREVHDAILGRGSPPVRHLRTLLGVAPHG